MKRSPSARHRRGLGAFALGASSAVRTPKRDRFRVAIRLGAEQGRGESFRSAWVFHALKLDHIGSEFAGFLAELVPHVTFVGEAVWTRAMQEGHSIARCGDAVGGQENLNLLLRYWLGRSIHQY